MNPALLVHVVGGSLAIGCGAVALAVRKGGRVHRASGGMFVAAMFAMGGAATLLALTLPDWANLPGGLFALYLVGTGWATLTRNGAVGRLVDDTRVARLFLAARAAAFREVEEDAFGERLILLFGALFEPAQTSAPGSLGRMTRVRERIDEEPAAANPLAELAALAGLSRVQLLRTFVRATGLTPHAYLVQRRLELARRLVRGGAVLAAAATEAGISDQSHMHRAFLARYGFTPGAYVQALRR